MIIDQTQLKGIKGKIERVCVGESVRVCVRERERKRVRLMAMVKLIFCNRPHHREKDA